MLDMTTGWVSKYSIFMLLLFWLATSLVKLSSAAPAGSPHSFDNGEPSFYHPTHQGASTYESPYDNSEVAGAPSYNYLPYNEGSFIHQIPTNLDPFHQSTHPTFIYGQPQYFQPSPPGEQMSPWDCLHTTPQPTYHHGHSLQVLIREQHHLGGESGSQGRDQHASQDFSQPKGQRLHQSDKRQQQTSEAGVRYVNKMKGKAKQRNTSKTQFIKYERVRNKFKKNHNYTLLDSFAEEEWNKYKKRKSQNTRRRKVINESRSQKGLPVLPLPSELQDPTLDFETWKAVNGFTYGAEGKLQHPHLQLPPTNPQEFPLFPTEPMREEYSEEEEEEGEEEEEEDESDAGCQGPSSGADSLYYTDMQTPIEYNFFGPHSRR